MPRQGYPRRQAVLYSTVQRCAVRCSAVQYGAVLCSSRRNQSLHNLAQRSLKVKGVIPQQGCPRVKAYPGLSQAAIRNGQARQLRLWLLLRSLDSQGKGWIEYEEAQKSFLALGLSRRSFRDTLSKGEGVWWVKNRGRIFLRGLEKVCLRFGVLPGRPVMVQLDRSLSKFKAALYTSFLNSRTISRAALRRLWGVSRTTMRRWEEVLGVDVRPNLGYASESLGEGEGIGFLAFDPEGVPYWEITLRGRRFLAWTIPNTYTYSVVETVPYGLARKVAKRIRPLLGGEGELRRLYFHEAKRAGKYLRKAGPPVYVWHGTYGKFGLWTRL